MMAGSAGMGLQYGTFGAPWSIASTVQWGYLRGMLLLICISCTTCSTRSSCAVQAGASTMSLQMILDEDGSTFDSAVIPLWTPSQ